MEPMAGGSSLVVREGREADLGEVSSMIDDFARGHPAEGHPRPLARLQAALLGEGRVAHLVVAERGGRLVGMAQWFLLFDVLWSMYGAQAEWLYVRPAARGWGVAAALIAEVCAQARRAGAEFLHGGGNDQVSRLYERIAIGSPIRECYLSAEAFQVVADLAGAPPRALVRGLPDRELNRVPARRR
jgi:GNAT superfamily N-acetyltransferase